MAPNNAILADAATILKVTAADAVQSEPAEAQDPDTPEGLEVASVAPSAATTDDATAMSEPVPLPTRRPAPSAQDDDQANWVKPSAYVNLREGPSSTARVVSVVAKGAKLRIVARKRGWVQVADPATSQSGWIYSSNVETMP